METQSANHDRLVWRWGAWRCCADGRFRGRRAESGSILSPRSAPFSRTKESAPARSTQHFVIERKAAARGGERRVLGGAAPHLLRRGTRAKNRDLVRCLVQKPFAARATSRTSTSFSANVCRSAGTQNGAIENFAAPISWGLL